MGTVVCLSYQWKILRAICVVTRRLGRNLVHWLLCYINFSWRQLVALNATTLQGWQGQKKEPGVDLFGHWSSFHPSTYLTSGRNMLPAIPQELSDTILDFLHDDVTALCSAGLVCKSWLPASRFHLFSDIKLNTGINEHRRFLEVICAECSTIPPYILSLSIVGSVDTLLRLPLLSNLESLSLMRIDMAYLTRDSKKRLTTLLQNLTALYLVSIMVHSCFLLYLDSLSHLRYWNSLKPLIKRLILLRPPLVWSVLNFWMFGAVKAAIILRRQLPRLWGRSHGSSALRLHSLRTL